MFRSVLRPSSGVSSCTLRNYYVSACLFRRIPVCGGMLSVCVYLRCSCRCGVWMCTVYTSRYHTDRYIASIHIHVVCMCILAMYLSVWCLDVYCVYIQTPHRQVNRKYTHTDNIPPQSGMRRSRQADT